MLKAKSPRRGRFALATFACLVVGLLASSSSALAVQSNVYDPFLDPTACPTSGPYLNDPAFPEVVCVASVANHTSLKIGDFEAAANVPTTLGFALAPSNPAFSSEVCPGVAACYRAVPGSTVVNAAPFRIDLPAKGLGKLKGEGKQGEKPPRGPQPSIKATVEAAGDVRAFAFSLSPTGQPLFSLPLKLHLEGAQLGDNCYVGSKSNPIVVALSPIAEPQLSGQEDPNGFPVLVINLAGLDTASNTFSVPAARGCGPSANSDKHKHSPFDEAIDSVLGLPSPAGQNLMVLAGSNTALVVASSGAILKAAIETAQQP